MNALILTCNTGEGHNSVSAAVREALLARGQNCEIVDALSFLPSGASEIICGVHVGMYRHMPKAYKTGYRKAETRPMSFEENSPVRRIVALGAEKLHAFVEAGGYDCLICPHVISSLIVTETMDRYPDMAVQTCNIATDYTCSPMTEDSRLDWYFVPDEGIAGDFIDAGVPAEKLVCIHGVPVRREFYSRIPGPQARRALGLPAKARHALMMFGSMGCGPIAKLTELLADAIPRDAYLTVICGTNDSLEKKLKKAAAGRENVRIIGYTEDVSLLMDSADIFITKPGGISTSEAAVKGLPMVLVDTVASCESYNMRLFCRRGGAVTADTPEELAELCAELLKDGRRRKMMSERLAGRENSAQEVCGKLMEAYPGEDEDGYQTEKATV